MHYLKSIRVLSVVLFFAALLALSGPATIPAAHAKDQGPALPSPLCDSVQVPPGHKLAFHTYAIGVRREAAERLGLRRISDLARHPELRLGFGHEFLARRDGWPGLRAAYRLAHRPRGLDHGLAYEALAAGEVDAIDLYSTDAKIARYDIAVLEDDRGFFPQYDAVLLHRRDVPERFPEAWAALQGLQGTIDAFLAEEVGLLRQAVATQTNVQAVYNAYVVNHETQTRANYRAMMDRMSAVPAASRRSFSLQVTR